MTTTDQHRLRATCTALALSAVMTTAPVIADQHIDAMRQDGSMGKMGAMNGMRHMGDSNMMTMVGGVMLEYRYMTMTMDGNRDGTDDLSTADVLGQGFMMASPEMTMDMHMLMAMYTSSSTWSWMAMLNYLDKEMDMVTAGGPAPTMSASGIGDLELAALYRFRSGPGYNLTARLGLTLPTGSIDEDNANGALPYPMQLGSGTFDLKPGIVYQRGMGPWSFRGEAIATLRTGENDEGYTLGNRYDLTAAAKRRVGGGFGVAGRLSYANWDNIDGSDDRIPPMSPYADPDRQAGTRWDLGVGVEYAVRGFNLGIEYSTPIAEDLDGPQMSTDNTLSFSASYMF